MPGGHATGRQPFVRLLGTGGRGLTGAGEEGGAGAGEPQGRRIARRGREAGREAACAELAALAALAECAREAHVVEGTVLASFLHEKPLFGQAGPLPSVQESAVAKGVKSPSVFAEGVIKRRWFGPPALQCGKLAQTARGAWPRWRESCNVAPLRGSLARLAPKEHIAHRAGTRLVRLVTLFARLASRARLTRCLGRVENYLGQPRPRHSEARGFGLSPPLPPPRPPRPPKLA